MGFLRPLCCAALVFGVFSACAHPVPPKQKAEQPELRKEALPIGTLAENEPQSAIPVEADDAVWGSPRALVTVVAFLDFQCHFCAQGYQTLLKLREGYSEDQLRIVFKHMPLASHEFAVPASVVGQAVTLHEGSSAFFTFAKKAFSHQASMSYENLAQWAEEAGLERATYNKAVGNEEVMHRVGSDVLLARRLGVDATPTFFINGKVLGGAQSIEYFRQVINAELAEMKDALGSRWERTYSKRLAANMKISLVETLLSQDSVDYLVPVGDSPVAGPATAPVTLVMFSDFECPFCKQAEETVRRLQSRYPENLRLVFKHLPLPFHEAARPAARLAIQVHKKKGDKAFFSLSHDLFESSPTLDEQTLRALGRKHGLSQEEIDQALAGKDDELDLVIEADRELSEDVLARGTPHFFVNGKRLPGARPIEHFDALIQHELERAQAALSSGVSPKKLYEKLQEDALSPGKPRKVDMVVPAAGQPTRGPEQAPVVVHIFSDFECPYCRQGELLLQQLEQEYPDKLRFVWHDFPLPFHQQALPAARAARQAFVEKGNEGFWALHGRMFALSKASAQVSNDEILAHAEELGLNVEQIEQAMTSDRHDAAIEKDQHLASGLGIDGTPAFVIGDYLVAGAGPKEKFERVIELVLSEEEASPKPPERE